jgi:hypothetical protein
VRSKLCYNQYMHVKPVTRNPARRAGRLPVTRLVLLLAILVLAGCGQDASVPRLARLLADPAAPAPMVSSLVTAMAGQQVTASPGAQGADLTLSLLPTPDSRLAYERILVPVDRFATLMTGTTMDELRGVWTGQVASSNFHTIYAGQNAMADLQTLLGPPSSAVKPQSDAAQVVDRVWEDHLGIGILPFDELVPRVRALPLDGLSALDNRLDQSKWPLAARAWLGSKSAQGAAALQRPPGQPLLSNRDPGRLTVLIMTGTTAITRGTGVAIEQSGDPAFPARVIGPVLAAADLTTVSNEIPFMDGCVADNSVGLMTFCAKPEWWATLALSGVKLVDLTGNHLIDFGTEPFTRTLAFYAEKGIKTYGGGINDEAARAPLIVEDHGNRLAFLGANQFGPDSDWAKADYPGSAQYDRDQMIVAIQTVKPKVDLVFTDLQWTEENGNGDYSVEPIPGQAEDFQALSDAGADVVTGVQAHAPQAAELRGNRLILYGLGNLYFDQTWSWETRTGMVVRHIIYEGRLLNTELLVTVIDPDMQLRWATPEERVKVLSSVFNASGW